MKLRGNIGIRPVRFPESYCESLFDPFNSDYADYVPMTFARASAVAVAVAEMVENVEVESADASEDEIVLIRSEDESEIGEMLSDEELSSDSSETSDTESSSTEDSESESSSDFESASANLVVNDERNRETEMIANCRRSSRIAAKKV
jgi:hypothetical protein